MPFMRQISRQSAFLVCYGHLLLLMCLILATSAVLEMIFLGKVVNKDAVLKHSFSICSQGNYVNRALIGEIARPSSLYSPKDERSLNF